MIRSDRSTIQGSPRPCTGQSLAVAVFALLAAVAMLPVLLTPIPAMVDYPNHLARMYILSQNGTPDANPYYQTAWALYPNLAMDLLIPQIARLVDVENATRLFLLLSQVLIVGGALMLERVVKGRVHLAGFAALMFLYCLPFTWGFLNFEFGLGVSLWAIAGYLAVAERSWPVRLVANAVFVVALFAAHFFALGIYGATVGIYELWRAADRKLPYSTLAGRLLSLALPVLVLLVAMRLTAGSIGSEGTAWHLEFKPIWPFRIMNGYNMKVSAATALVLMASLYFAARRGFLKFELAGVWLALGFALLYLAIPSQLVGTSFADFRMIPAAALILPAFCALTLPDRRWTIAALVIVGSITLANMAIVFAIWLSYRADYAAMIASFRKIQHGSLIMVGASGNGEDPPFQDLTQYPMTYAPALAVHYIDAFVPNVFSETGKQPVQVRASVRRLSIPYGGPMPMRVLAAIAAGKAPAGVPSYALNWSRDFDYLYVLGPHVANPLPDLLEPLDGSARFVLYKIRRTPG